MPKKIDPITVEIIQSSLQAACDEMFIAMRKTAMSSIIYEVLDFGTAVTDSNGNIAASGAGIPAFIAMCDKAVQAVLNKFDDKEIKPGDIFATNDPYNGTLSKFSAHLIVSGSALSPARNKLSKLLKSYFEKNLPSGSSFLIALKAVGAVNKDLTLQSDMIFQKAPASGVPTGLPSNKTVAQPLNNGA